VFLTGLAGLLFSNIFAYAPPAPPVVVLPVVVLPVVVLGLSFEPVADGVSPIFPILFSISARASLPVAFWGL